MRADDDMEIDEDEEENYAYIGGSNIFADFDRSGAGELYARSQLLRQIYRLFRERQLSHLQVAEELGVSEAVAADLMNARFNEFSISQLFAFLDTLGYDAEITIHPRTPMKQVSLRRKAKTLR